MTRHNLSGLQRLIVAQEALLNGVDKALADDRWDGSWSDWYHAKDGMVSVLSTLRDIYDAYPELH